MMNSSKEKLFYSHDSETLHFCGRAIELGEYSARCLEILIRMENTIVSKNQIQEECWGKKGIYVTDSSVRRLISQVRRALSELAGPKQIVVTVPRKGYLLLPGMIEINTVIQNYSGKKNIGESSFTGLNISNISLKALTGDFIKRKFLDRQLIKKTLIIFSFFLLVLASALILWHHLTHRNIEVIKYDFLEHSDNLKNFFQQRPIVDESSKNFTEKNHFAKNIDMKNYKYLYYNKAVLKKINHFFLCENEIDANNSQCISVHLIMGGL